MADLTTVAEQDLMKSSVEEADRPALVAESSANLDDNSSSSGRGSFAEKEKEDTGGHQHKVSRNRKHEFEDDSRKVVSIIYFEL